MTETLSDALSRTAGANRLLVALDFDGTLASFTEDPADSRPLPAAREALNTLADLPRTTVAIISGRPLEFLRAVVDPAHRMVLSGSHGAEMDLAALSDAPEPVTEDSSKQLQVPAIEVEGTWDDFVLSELKAYAAAVTPRERHRLSQVEGV